MCKKSKKPARLEKKVSRTEKIQEWIDTHNYLLIIMGFIMIAILLVVIIFGLIHSGTESGLWYNYFNGGI